MYTYFLGNQHYQYEVKEKEAVLCFFYKIYKNKKRTIISSKAEKLAPVTSTTHSIAIKAKTDLIHTTEIQTNLLDGKLLQYTQLIPRNSMDGIYTIPILFDFRLRARGTLGYFSGTRCNVLITPSIFLSGSLMHIVLGNVETQLEDEKRGLDVLAGNCISRPCIFLYL